MGAPESMAPNGEEDHRDKPTGDANQNGKGPELGERFDKGQHHQRNGIKKHGESHEAAQGPAQRQPAAKQLPQQGGKSRYSQKSMESFLIKTTLGEYRLIKESQTGRDQAKQGRRQPENPKRGRAQ